jgi:UDP-GlcNAc:undecaprenyl-phosphate GlcNAc-1-phosphate transferase
VPPKWRLLAEAGAAIALFAAGLGWETHLPGVLDFALTIASVVIAVNAFNLMDNLDGACGTVTAVAAAGVGALAAIKGEVVTAGLAFALSGACAGFLPWNLTRPARIFLGDGGSMPAGFLIAALAMSTVRHASAGNAGLLVGALLAGLPIFDAALVSYSRTRRGVTIVTGGRDHLSHRLLLAMGSPQAVAVALAVLQALLSTLAIVGYELGGGAVAWLALCVFLSGVVGVLVLDTARWRPAGIAFGRPEQSLEAAAEHLAVPTGAGIKEA